MSFYENSYRSVKEFHIAFGLDVDAVWTPALLRLRKKLIEEEYGELQDEWHKFPSDRHNQLKETCDLVYVLLGTVISLGVRPNYEGYGLSVNSTLNWLDSGLYGDGTQVREALGKHIGATINWLYGGDYSKQVLSDAFQRVHDSNMSKLVNGQTLRNEDGKVLKGPNYRPCDLSDLV
jgi:predicted HAD superfamily Cof-like phosphohydrolase